MFWYNKFIRVQISENIVFALLFNFEHDNSDMFSKKKIKWESYWFDQLHSWDDLYHRYNKHVLSTCTYIYNVDNVYKYVINPTSNLILTR